MFLSSLSFFLFHRFSFFFSCLLFFVSYFTFIFRKKYVFVLCPCRDAQAFSHHGKEKKNWWNHLESVVKNQIACVVKIELCELRIGRKHWSMSSLLPYLLLSLQFLYHIFWNSSLSQYLVLSIVYFSTQRNSLSFLWTRMGTNYLLFVVKIFVCALCCANLLFGISISLISKTEQISALHCEQIFPFFAICWKKLVFLIRNFFSSWFTSSFSYLSLTVVCSVVAMTRTLAAGHPLASSRLISCFFFFSCFDCLLFFLTIVCFFVFLFLLHSLLFFFFPPCVLFHLFLLTFSSLLLKTLLVLALLLWYPLAFLFFSDLFLSFCLSLHSFFWVFLCLFVCLFSLTVVLLFFVYMFFVNIFLFRIVFFKVCVVS